MSNPFIIGISGKKQSGKSVLAEDIQKALLSKNKSIGQVKIYSFADCLKKLCIDILDLSFEQCYGTDRDKNSLTQYKWEKLPEEINLKYSNSWFMDGFGLLEEEEWNKICINGCPNKDYPALREGFMTVREVFQVVGTNVFREYFSDDIWVRATFRQIIKDNPQIALISDVRFPSEVDGVIDNGGYIIRLLRNRDSEDLHKSETALDDYDFVSWGERVCIVDNRNLSIEEKNKIVFKYLDEIMKGF